MGSRLKVYTVFVLLLLLTVFPHFTNGITQLSFKSVHSRYNAHYFTNFTIQIVNDTIYNDFELIERLDPGVRCRLEFQLRIANSNIYQSLFDFDIDVCSTIIALKDHFLKSWYRSLLKFGNFMENCPFHADHYYLNGWLLEPALFPKYLYPGDYKMIAFIYNGQYKKKNMDFVMEVQLETVVS
ncbi:uncharacterized protein LOC105210612 [Zeugodacus cucurbitae]|uniref:uncharacterized protein LOC105210612 n=1 Tax=Zeugodacus cucurbitae TaxID=28588 RepID=UPI0023D92062|nr:uncharacterized protein LOC105210612 [Zeugodacus cucurbitae]